MSFTDDEGFEPIAPGTDPFEADEELELLQPAVEADDGLAVEFAAPPPLGRAPVFDFAARDIVPAAAGGPLMSYGRETLSRLVAKMLHTRKGENPAVDPDFGMVVMAEDILDDGGPPEESGIAEYVDDIERAVVLLPRVTGVDDVRVEFEDGDDAMFVSITIDSDDDELAGETLDAFVPVAGAA